ncbi:MAG: BamA/TamA family outer membrane protein [Candidatus Kapabacteria bacterium]|nr:BamA/TamA family outer membrane protein [Candidatus Kapabacteria bacterium]
MALLLSSANILSQSKIYPGLFTSERNNFEFEIAEIRFVGNNSFGAKELMRAITTRTTSRNPIHQLLQMFYTEGLKNKTTPKTILKYLKKDLIGFEKELVFFEQSIAERDTMSLLNFYNKNGFHYSQVKFTFRPDSLNKKNILTFYIKEGRKNLLGDIIYNGLDNLDNEISSKVEDLKTIKSGDNFSEDNITSEMISIRNYLVNNGYYYSNVFKPLVKLNAKNQDSVVITFNTGKRYKVGKVFFIDSLRGQNVIAGDLKSNLLDIREGEYIRQIDIDRTQNNLFNLSTFDIVKIDTSSMFAPMKDSILNFNILTQYNKQQNWGIGFFLNQLANDNPDILNGGIQLDYTHKNLWGAAQQFKPFVKTFIRDLSQRPFEKIYNGELEYALGFNFQQPFIFNFDKWRFGLSSSPQFIRSTRNSLILNTINIPFRIPIKLPEFTIFTNAQFELAFENQNPENYEEALKKENLKSDSAKKYEILYDNLNKYKHSGVSHLFTSNLISFTISGDKRNHPFQPTRGYYINLNTEFAFSAGDFWGGLARYNKTQLNINYFTPLATNLTGAFKLRLGHISFFDNTNQYIPIERQFFAGGANSVRGWEARRLRYSNLLKDSSNTFLQEFVGNSSIIEGSVEFRLKFVAPDNYDEMIAYNINNSGLVGFFDFGNVFGWFVPDDKTPNDFSKLALAGGFGYRYDTPIGVIRLDLAWPLYDPLGIKQTSMNDLQFHIAIGHAF